MSSYQVDWVGAIGAAISAVIAFLIAKRLFRAPAGVPFYVVVGLITFALALGLRSLLRHIGI